jgi:hypothetical protein
MVDGSVPGSGSPVTALLDIEWSLAQVVMLETEHQQLNSSKALKQGMPQGWNRIDMFARYDGLNGFELSGATVAQEAALQKKINVAEGREKVKRTRAAKKQADDADGLPR